jgi:drug/metabolite transporter (DMT)-like permease
VTVAAPTLGIASALACALAWTVLTLVTRTLSAHFTSFSLNILRSAVGGLLLVALAAVAGDTASLGRLDGPGWACLLVSVVTSVGIGDTAFFESARALGLARAMTVSTSYPLMAALLALAFFGERITLLVGAGSVVTLAGLGLIVSERAPDRAGAPAGAAGGRERGLALALTAAAAWAVSAILIRRPLEDADPITVQAVRLPLTALLLWATPWARGTLRTLSLHRHAVGWRVLLLGALTALSAVTYVAGLKLAGITLGTVLSSTSPLFALPIGLVAFGERLTWRATLGAVLATAGVALLSV